MGAMAATGSNATTRQVRSRDCELRRYPRCAEPSSVTMIEDARGIIDYHEQGSGPTTLFVPGSWGTRSAWCGVIAALPGRFRIVTTSLLG
jgi:pimeloyl-ACP methyl ester carboxylesterase